MCLEVEIVFGDWFGYVIEVWSVWMFYFGSVLVWLWYIVVVIICRFVIGLQCCLIECMLVGYVQFDVFWRLVGVVDCLYFVVEFVGCVFNVWCDVVVFKGDVVEELFVEIEFFCK